MDKPIIGIVPTFNNNKDASFYQDRSIFVNMYNEKIISAGGIPIGLLSRNMQDYLSICDGYLWPGGKKIEWAYFKVIEDTIKNGKSLLGVCLGMQSICTYFNILEDRVGNDSIKDTYDKNKMTNPYLQLVDNINIHSHHITSIESISTSRHSIEIYPNTILSNIYKSIRRDVISLHNYCIPRISSELTVSARSSDNVVEAIEYTKNNCSILGVQFHPEIEEDNLIFDYLIDSSKKKIKKK